MAKKLKYIPAELARQMGKESAWITQGIKIHKKLYARLLEGLKVYCSIENGDLEQVAVKENEQLKLFCSCNRYNAKTYLLLRLAGVKKVGDLLDKENSVINRNWARVQEYV
tara:strand:- start:250 stop:582 length:333 start_codon:yes stop_codon:yes gene_type:complete